MRRIVAASAAILVTTGLGIAGSTAAVAHERDRATVNAVEPKPFDICDFRPYLSRCRDAGTVEPVEPKPVIGRAEIVVPFPIRSR